MISEFANSGWMYLLGALVCVFVLTTSVVFIVKAIKDAKKIKMDISILKQTLVTSVVFSLLPSISILIGVISLAGTLGIPLPWIRLSVIGALHYEQTAVKTAYDDITLSSLTAQQYVTIAFVMTTFILAGPLFCLFGFKAYDKKILSKARENVAESSSADAAEAVASTDGVVEGEEKGENKENFDLPPVEKPKKKSFGPVLFSAAFIALICSFLAEEICKLQYIGMIDEVNPKTDEVYGALGTYTPAVVVAVAFCTMAIFDFIAKKTKWKWLDDFALGLSMLAGMASAVVIAVL